MSNSEEEISRLVQVTDDLAAARKELAGRLDLLERVYVFLGFDKVQAILEKSEVPVP